MWLPRTIAPGEHDTVRKKPSMSSNGQTGLSSFPPQYRPGGFPQLRRGRLSRLVPVLGRVRRVLRPEPGHPFTPAPPHHVHRDQCDGQRGPEDCGVGDPTCASRSRAARQCPRRYPATPRRTTPSPSTPPERPPRSSRPPRRGTAGPMPTGRYATSAGTRSRGQSRVIESSRGASPKASATRSFHPPRSGQAPADHSA